VWIWTKNQLPRGEASTACTSKLAIFIRSPF
jgi:hypothetical protein